MENNNSKSLVDRGSEQEVLQAQKDPGPGPLLLNGDTQEGANPKWPAQSATEFVKDLGRKARERLQEQRSKRREIVRLENEPVILAPLAVPTTAKATHTTRTGVKRKRPSAKPSNLGDVNSNSNIDSWYPDVTAFATYEGEERSYLVRLHGLPIGCKPEEIRRFFSSLEPERVVVLPSMGKQLVGWDADVEAASISRYESTFRVYVKFPSSPLAILATERTGEILYCGKGDCRMGVKIAVTQVSKVTAQFLLKNMAIEATPGMSISETMLQVETRLHKSVPSLLWSTTMKRLGMKMIDNANGYPWELDTSKLRPNQNLRDYQRLATLCNQYVDEYDKLVNAESVLRIHEFDPSMKSNNDVLALTQTCASILFTEVHALQEWLCRARFERRHKEQE